MVDASAIFLGLIWDNLLAEPSSFWVALIALGVLCWRYRGVPLPALIPLFLFVGLYCANEAWNLVEAPPPVGHMANDKLVPFKPQEDLALSAALKVAQDQIMPAAALQGAENAERLVVAVIDPATAESRERAGEWYQGGIFLAAVTYFTVAIVVCVLVIPLMGPKFAAFTLMLIALYGAELWTAVVHWWACDVLMETTSAVELDRTWGQGVATSVCERETGGPWYEMGGMLIFVALMWWVLERYTHVLQKIRAEN